MNGPSSTSRFSCRVARGWVMLFGSSQRLGRLRWASRHVEQCESCQKFYASGKKLDALLKADARAFPAARVDLAEEIIRSLRSSPPRARVEKRPRFAWFVSIGAVGIAAALTLVIAGQKKPLVKPELASATPEDVHQSLLAAQTASQKWWASVKPSAVALTEHDPLNEELNSVVEDARSAAIFLERNFVPDSKPSTQDSTRREG